MRYQLMQIGLITLGLGLGLSSCSGGASSANGNWGSPSGNEPQLAYSCEGLEAATGGQPADCGVIEQLRNGQYTIPDLGFIQLVNGRFDAPDGRRVEYLDPPSPTALGSLTGGTTATASLISVSTGTRTSVYLVLSAEQGDRFNPTAMAYLGDSVQVQSIRFNEGQVQVNLLTRAAADPPCCPTLEAERFYAFDGTELELVNHHEFRVPLTSSNAATTALKGSQPATLDSKALDLSPQTKTSQTSAALLPPLKNISPADSQPRIADGLSSPSDRTLYTTVDLPDGIANQGRDPMTIAIAAFGAKEPMAASYRESAWMEEGENGAIVTLILENLPDDAVGSLRYRLEFTAVDAEWRVEWIGMQTLCGAELGYPNWHSTPCP